MKHNWEKKSIQCFFLIFLLLLTLYLEISSLKLIVANPVTVWGERLELGGILPAEMNSNLSMTNAEVLMEIDATSFREGFLVTFDGNYTITNSGDTTEIQVGAPFYSPYFGYSSFQNYDEMLEDMNNTLKITVNSIEIPFLLSYINESLAVYWHQYIPDVGWTRLFAVCNITLGASSENVLRFSWIAHIQRHTRSKFVDFYYDVGTSRGWEGTISETVTFKVIGHQPQYYTDYEEDHFEKQCQISNFKEGKLYSWEWLNERINESVVGVRYDTDKWTEYILYFFVIIPLVTIASVIFAIFILRKRKLKM